jgi:hypothetical protein
MRTDVITNSAATEDRGRVSGAALENRDSTSVKTVAYLGAGLFGIAFWWFIILLIF